jgi:hypothetical protein
VAAVVNINNWAGAAVVLLIVALVLGVLWANPEQFHPRMALEEAQGMQDKNEYNRQLYNLDLQQKQLDMEEALRKAQYADERRRQAIVQDQERHNVWMAAMAAGLPWVFLGVAIALVCLGVGGAYLLYCRGQQMLRRPDERPQPDAEEHGGRIVQFPGAQRKSGTGR